MGITARMRRRVAARLLDARVLIVGDADAAVAGIRAAIGPAQLVAPGDDADTADVAVVVIDRKASGSTLHRAQDHFARYDGQITADAPRIALIVHGAMALAPSTLARLLAPEVARQIMAASDPSLATATSRADRRRQRALAWAGIDILRIRRIRR